GTGCERVRRARPAEHAAAATHDPVAVVHLPLEHELDVVDVVGVAGKDRAGGDPEDAQPDAVGVRIADEVVLLDPPAKVRNDEIGSGSLGGVDDRDARIGRRLHVEEVRPLRSIGGNPKRYGGDELAAVACRIWYATAGKTGGDS